METNNRSDAELVQDALKERHAFAAIVDRYEPPLRRYVVRLGVAREDVDDVLQEAFIKIYVNLNDFDTSLSLGAWMYRIVHNEAISHFRKQNVRPRVVDSEDDTDLFERIADDTDIPAEIDERKMQEAVREAIDALSTQYRDVFVLRVLEEKSYDEIADILQIPSGTVATYINRGKKELRDALKKFHDESV